MNTSAVQTATSIRTLSAPPEPTARGPTSRLQVDGPDDENNDSQDDNAPDGGREALSVLWGCTCLGFAGLALLNCPGTLQAWLSENQLADESIARLGWIFGFYTFVCFFAGIQIGPFFDAYGPRRLAWIGSTLVTATYLLIGLCYAYWHYFLVLGLLGGLGTSILMTCTVSTVQLWFWRYRGTATAVALCGGSLGGIVFPFVLASLFPRLGFAWTMRAIALMIAPFLLMGSILVRGRHHRRRRHHRRGQGADRIVLRTLLFQPKLLFAPDMITITIGVFCLEWALFIVLTYISSYALHNGLPFGISFHLLTYLNCGSLVGRLGAGVLGDFIGRFNTQIAATASCTISILALWLQAGQQPSLVVLFAVTFGLASGSSLSLTPVCLGQLCGTANYGRVFTSVYAVSSFGYVRILPSRLLVTVIMKQSFSCHYACPH